MNDVVAFEGMRAAAAQLTPLLLDAARSDDGDASGFRSELAAMRGDVLAVDAFDRAAVTELADRIGRRVAELRERPRG